MTEQKDLPVPPTALELRLRSPSPIPARKMVRHICFRDNNGRTKAVPIQLERSATNPAELEGAAGPEGLEILKSMIYAGRRSYWDRMTLENRGGDTALPLSHIRLRIRYAIPDQDADNRIERLEIVDSSVSTTLAAENGSINLEPMARASRMRLAGVDVNAHPAVVLAVLDLGKCGSDGSDQWGDNPKYAAPTQALCSEFVSWYYHTTNVVIESPGEFKTIDFTGELSGIFERANRLYAYQVNDGTFVNTHDGSTYAPRSGDFLERRGGAKSEHSMLVVSWDASRRVITVVNGPWPVTLRKIELSTIAQTQGKAFFLGRVESL